MGNATTYGLRLDVTKLNQDKFGKYYKPKEFVKRSAVLKKSYTLSISSSCYVSFDSKNEKIIQTKMLNDNSVQIFKAYFDDKEKKITIYEPETNKITFFERSKAQIEYSQLQILVPPFETAMILNCGDIINFHTKTGLHARFLVREIVNENEKIKFSAEPPKQNTDTGSLRNNSCIYHNTESTTPPEHACRHCDLINNKHSQLLYLCKNCPHLPIHNHCLNMFVYENLHTEEEDNVIYFTVSDMVCHGCGEEYPKTFKYKDKKVQLQRQNNDVTCPYIVLESLDKNNEKGIIVGMMLKFDLETNKFNSIRLGTKAAKNGSFSDLGVEIGARGDSDEINGWMIYDPTEGTMRMSDDGSSHGVSITKFNPPGLPDDGECMRIQSHDHLLEISYKKKIKKSSAEEMNSENPEMVYLSPFRKDHTDVWVDENDKFDIVNFLVMDKDPEVNVMPSSAMKRKPLQIEDLRGQQSISGKNLCSGGLGLVLQGNGPGFSSV